MKKIIPILILFCVKYYAIGQNTYFTRTGHIYFISETKAIDIDANNYQVASFLDIKTGKVQAAVLIKSFEFDLATAKEHFNESYMESDKYPKASFKGKIINPQHLDLEEGKKQNVMVKGVLSIRAIKKTIEVPIEIYAQNKFIIAKSDFQLSIDDFNIRVPSLLENRVAKQIKVKVSMQYSKYKK